MHGEGMGYTHDRINSGEQGGFGMSAGSLNGEVEAPEAVADASGFGGSSSTVQGERQISDTFEQEGGMAGKAWALTVMTIWQVEATATGLPKKKVCRT